MVIYELETKVCTNIVFACVLGLWVSMPCIWDISMDELGWPNWLNGKSIKINYFDAPSEMRMLEIILCRIFEVKREVFLSTKWKYIENQWLDGAIWYKFLSIRRVQLQTATLFQRHGVNDLIVNYHLSHPSCVLCVCGKFHLPSDLLSVQHFVYCCSSSCYCWWLCHRFFVILRTEWT